jgi:hypothetical protein
MNQMLISSFQLLSTITRGHYFDFGAVISFEIYFPLANRKVISARFYETVHSSEQLSTIHLK